MEGLRHGGLSTLGILLKADRVTTQLCVYPSCLAVTVCSDSLIRVASRQWTSFLAGCSTAGYVYLYSIYYFFFKTK